jgi:hypothetical protein
MKFRFPTTNKKPTVAEAAATVASLKAELFKSTETQRDLDNASATMFVLAREQPLPANMAAATKASDLATAGRNKMDTLRDALAAAEQRHQELAAAEAATRVTAITEEIAALADTRPADVAEAIRGAAIMRGAIDRLIATGQTILAKSSALNGRLRDEFSTTAMLAPGEIEMGIRTHMARTGCGWAAGQYRSLADQFPLLDERMATGNATVAHWCKQTAPGAE